MFKWRFPSNDYGENKGINDSGVAMFRGTPLQSLAREICQNSLDAAIKDKTIIEFNLFNIPSDKVPGRDVLLDTFNRCLKFWGSQTSSDTKDFFTDAINELSKDECIFWIFSNFLEYTIIDLGSLVIIESHVTIDVIISLIKIL